MSPITRSGALPAPPSTRPPSAKSPRPAIRDRPRWPCECSSEDEDRPGERHPVDTAERGMIRSMRSKNMVFGVPTRRSRARYSFRLPLTLIASGGILGLAFLALGPVPAVLQAQNRMSFSPAAYNSGHIALGLALRKLS